MLYVLNLTSDGAETVLTQIRQKLFFNNVAIPNLIVNDKMDIRNMRKDGGIFINDDISIRYDENQVIIDKVEDRIKRLPTRATLLVSSVRVKGIAGMAKIEGTNLNELKNMDLVYPSVFIPLGSSGKYHFAMVIADEFDVSFKEDGTYHVDVSRMECTKAE